MPRPSCEWPLPSARRQGGREAGLAGWGLRGGHAGSWNERDGGRFYVVHPLDTFWSPEGKAESSSSGRTEGARAWAAPLSCPTGLRPAPVSFPAGQGCEGTCLCLRAGGQRDLTLFLLSFCSSRTLKELWVCTLLG